VETAPVSTILLLDDDAVLRDVIATQLRAAGHHVVAVASIAEAAAITARDRFDQLVIDQRLDREDGVSALCALRQTDGARHARAIAISAELDDGQRRSLEDAGFAMALLKPVPMAALLACFRDAPQGIHQGVADTACEPVLDDAAAVAIWGAASTVTMLRAMLLTELDTYRIALQECCVRKNPAELRDVLHRMRSSAGFCGAVGLTRFIDSTAIADPDWHTLPDRYNKACIPLIPALQASLVT
jgi:CheY-like chemotaxis protein